MKKDISGMYRMKVVEKGRSLEHLQKRPFMLGLMCFTPQGEMMFSRKSEEGDFSYMGYYIINEHDIDIEPVTSTEPFLIGKTMNRKIVSQTENQLVLLGGNRLGEFFKVTWEKLN